MMLNIGIIGNGAIVSDWIKAAKSCSGVNIVAGYCRSEAKKEFFKQRNIERIYLNVDEFLKDEFIDVVYIALPNFLHYDYSKKALLASKHVICEKPFTANEKEAQHLFALALKQKKFIFEAICNVYHPHFLKLKALVKTARIQQVMGSFCQQSSRYEKLLNNEVAHVFNPLSAGGVLMDLMVYLLHGCIALFDMPQNLHYMCRKHDNGIDLNGTLFLKYDSFDCTLVASKISQAPSDFIVMCHQKTYRTQGSISVMPFLLENEKVLEKNPSRSHLAYQISEFARIITTNDQMAYVASTQQTLKVMACLDQARQDIGLVFLNNDYKTNL